MEFRDEKENEDVPTKLLPDVQPGLNNIQGMDLKFTLKMNIFIQTDGGGGGPV